MSKVQIRNSCPHITTVLYDFRLRSSRPEVFLGQGVLKICCKFTGEHPRRSTKQLYWNRTLAWVFSCKFTAYFQISFLKKTYGYFCRVNHSSNFLRSGFTYRDNLRAPNRLRREREFKQLNSTLKKKSYIALDRKTANWSRLFYVKNRRIVWVCLIISWVGA